MEKADTDSETELYNEMDKEIAENNPASSEEDVQENIQVEVVKPKPKPKPNRRKIRSVAQQEAFKKAQATRKANLEKKKQAKLAEQHKAYLASQKSEANDISDAEPSPKTSRKKAGKKPKKVVYVEESESSSEEEVVVRRKKKRQPRPPTPKREPDPEPNKTDYFQFI